MTDDSGGSVLLSLRIISTLKKKKKERIQPPLWLEGRKTSLVNIEKLGCCKAKYTRGEKKTNLQALCDRLCIFNSESIYAKQLLLLPPNCPKQQEGNTPRYFFGSLFFELIKPSRGSTRLNRRPDSIRVNSRSLDHLFFLYLHSISNLIKIPFSFFTKTQKNKPPTPPPKKKINHYRCTSFINNRGSILMCLFVSQIVKHPPGPSNC